MDENDGRYQGILGTELPAVTDPRGLHGAPSPSAPRQGRLWNGRFHALDMDDDTHGDTLSIDLGFGIQEPSRKNMFASWYDASQNYHGTCTKNCDGKWCWKMNHGLEVVVAICVFHALLSTDQLRSFLHVGRWLVLNLLRQQVSTLHQKRESSPQIIFSSVVSSPPFVASHP